MELILNRSKITTFLIGIVFSLTILHVSQLVIYYYVNDPNTFDFIQMVDFDYEANLPSIYSALAILYCGVLLSVIAKEKQKTQDQFRTQWVILSYIFYFLGIDEAAALHEEIGDFVEGLNLFNAEGWLYFAWVVPYGALLTVFVASYLKFLINLPRYYQWRFIFAGALFITGAIGIETVSASEADAFGTETVLYSILYTCEELCEMIAIIFFSNTLMKYIEEHIGSLQFKFSD